MSSAAGSIPQFGAASWSDPVAFAERVLPFLLRHEAANCLPIGLLGSDLVLNGGAFLVTVEAGSDLAGVAMMTPPWNLIVTAGTDPACLPALLDHAMDTEFSIPGVTGPTALSGVFARLWSERSGRGVHRQVAERIYELRAVTPVEGIPGQLRAAVETDRTLLVEWTVAFLDEAIGPADQARAAQMVDDALRPSPEGRRLFLWEDAGTVVSMVGVAGRTPTGIRVGPVYTPPEHRRRGYASGAVATLSQDMLDSGRGACFLFTDLANPTSNHIYQAIGYRPVIDVDLYVFPADDPAD